MFKTNYIRLFQVATIIIILVTISGHCFASSGALEESANNDQSSVGIWSFFKQIVVDFWSGVYSTIKSTLRDVIKQVFTSVHQTIGLLFVMWIMKRGEKKLVELQPSIVQFVDKYSSNTDIEKKQKTIAYLNDVILNSINIVEASFLRQVNVEDITSQEKLEFSKQKMSATLSLVFNSIIQDKMDRFIFSDNDEGKQVQQILLLIEKKLNDDRVKSSKPSTTKTTEAGEVDEKTQNKIKRVRFLIDNSQQRLPVSYQTAIATNIQNLFNLS